MQLKEVCYEVARTVVPKEYRPAVRRKLYDLQDLVRSGIPNLYRYGRLDVFNWVNFELNGNCNFNQCWYCPNSVTEGRRGRMSNEVFDTMLQQLSQVGVDGFRGTMNPNFFGEPTIYGEALVTRMRDLREHLPSARLVVHTNGIKLTKDLYDQLIQAGVDQLIITRHPGAPTKNVDCLLSQLPNDEKTRVLDRNLDNLKLWNRRPFVQIPSDRVLHLERCPIPSTQLTIAYNGDVLFCSQDFSASVVLGNIMQENVLDIWDKKDYKKRRDDIRGGVYNFSPCIECMDLDLKDL